MTLPAEIQNGKDKIPYLSLEKAGLDLLNTRTQLFLGLTVVALLCGLNFWSVFTTPLSWVDVGVIDSIAKLSHDPLLIFQEQWYSSNQSTSPVTAATFLFIYLFCKTNALGYHLAILLLYFSCSVLIALLCLEITGRFGNRMGAAPAIWSALLFSVYPFHAYTIISIEELKYQWTCFLALLLLFSLSRLVLLKDKFYLTLFVVSGIILAINGYPDESRLFSYDPPGTLASKMGLLFLLPDSYDPLLISLIFAYVMLGLLLLTRLLLKTSSPLIPSCLLAACLLAMLFHPCLVGLLASSLPSDLSASIVSAVLYGAIPLCLLLALAAIPSLDSSQRVFARYVSVLGIICLVIIFVVWAQILHIAVQGLEGLVATLSTPNP